MTTIYPDSIRSDAVLGAPSAIGPRQIALGALFLTVATVEFSIALAQMLFAVAAVAWAATLFVERRRPSGPGWAIPLVLYAGWSLVSAFFSLDPRTSFVDCKQLLLLLIVPLTYELVDESSAVPLTTVVLIAGACSALVGIGQYAILHYDLQQRIRGTLGHWMTFSGLMMLVLNVAVARVLFLTRSWVWPAVVMPALAVVLALTFTRSAWVGWCLAVALLLAMRNFRLTALLPVIAAVFFILAPAPIVERFYSIFNRRDTTSSDRLTMLRAGEQIVRAHPITGVGPSMVERVYPQYRDSDAAPEVPPHLHNVPMQIAAERGLPALGLWVWCIGAIVMGAISLFGSSPREGPVRFLAAAALASVVSMLGAGMFEHNFGDSEFLMLFAVLVTLPFAVARRATGRRVVSAGSGVCL